MVPFIFSLPTNINFNTPLVQCPFYPEKDTLSTGGSRTFDLEWLISSRIPLGSHHHKKKKSLPCKTFFFSSPCPTNELRKHKQIFLKKWIQAGMCKMLSGHIEQEMNNCGHVPLDTQRTVFLFHIIEMSGM